MSIDDDVLVCEFALRPRGAPTFLDVAPSLRRLHEERGALLLQFEAAAAPAVRDFVAAERLCCPTIDWVLSEDAAELRIATTPGRLATLKSMFEMAGELS